MQRKLTKFLCREMLYDYATDHLDPSRKSAVEDFLKTEVDLREELAEVKFALDYCNGLSKTKISEPFFAEIKESKTYWRQLIEQMDWRHWPEAIRWGTQALAVSVVAAGLAIFFPWKMILDYIPKERPAVVSKIVVPSPSQKTQQQEEVQPPQSVEPQVIASIPENTNELTETDSEDEGIESSGQEPTTAAETKEEQGESEEASKVKPAKVVGTKQALKGELYRAFMNHVDVEAITPDIVAKIKELGGVKAGKVKLGWRKSNGSYFHMAIDKKHYDEFLEFLKNFGPVQLYKDPHWRVMPEGKMRLILTVEDAGKEN